MAISSSAVWEIRTTGSDSNAGFYVSGGTDYSQSDTPVLSLSDVVTNGTTTVTSATGGFTSAMIGNGINIAGAIRQITARASTNSITVDATVTTGSGQVGRIGGALASPSKALSSLTWGNTVWLKGGLYSLAASLDFSAITGVSSGATQPTLLTGYSTVRGDRGRPILRATAGINLITTKKNVQIANLELDGNSQSGAIGVRASYDQQIFRNLYIHHCTSSGIRITGSDGSNYVVDSCEVSYCGNGVFADDTVAQIYVSNTWAHHNVSTGILAHVIENCIMSDNATGCVPYYTGYVGHSRFYNNSVTGISAYNDKTQIFRDCIFYANATAILSNNLSMSANCAFGANSNNYSTVNDQLALNKINQIALSANPYLNAATGDFRLTSAAQTTLYAAGFDIPSSWLQSLGGGGSGFIGSQFIASSLL